MSPYTPNLPFAPDLGLRDSYAFSVALPTSTESGNHTIGKTDGSEEAKEEHAGEESRAGPGSSYVGDHGGVRGDASASGASSETATVRNVKINRTFAPIFFAFFSFSYSLLASTFAIVLSVCERNMIGSLPFGPSFSLFGRSFQPLLGRLPFLVLPILGFYFFV